MMVWERETEEQATINDDDDDGAAAEMREKELTGEIGRAHV